MEGLVGDGQFFNVKNNISVKSDVNVYFPWAPTEAFDTSDFFLRFLDEF